MQIDHMIRQFTQYINKETLSDYAEQAEELDPNHLVEKSIMWTML